MQCARKSSIIALECNLIPITIECDSHVCTLNAQTSESSLSESSCLGLQLKLQGGGNDTSKAKYWCYLCNGNR